MGYYKGYLGIVENKICKLLLGTPALQGMNEWKRTWKRPTGDLLAVLIGTVRVKGYGGFIVRRISIEYLLHIYQDVRSMLLRSKFTSTRRSSYEDTTKRHNFDSYPS